MTAPAKPARKPLHPIAVGLYTAFIVLAVVAVSAPEASFGQMVQAAPYRLSPAAAGAIQWLAAALTALVTVSLGVFFARRVARGGGLWRSLGVATIYGLSGMPVGFVLAQTHVAFGAVPQMMGAPAMAAVGSFGVFEVVALIFGGLLIYSGIVASTMSVNAAVSQAWGWSSSAADRRQTRPAGIAMALEGAALILLTFAHGLDWSQPEPLHWALLAAIPALAVADLLLQALCWRTADELFRQAWVESMGLTLAVGLPVATAWTALSLAGFVPDASAYHLIVAGYIGYVVIAIVITARRMSLSLTCDAAQEPVREPQA